MDAWIFWGIIALLTLIVEIFTTGIALICFSVGAAGAMVIAIFGGGVTLQVVAFALVSILALILLRPFIIKWIEKRATNCPTNVDALVGRTATVTQPFARGEGRVSIDGDDWKAVCGDDAAQLAEGDRVEVTEVNSVVLTIKKI